MKKEFKLGLVLLMLVGLTGCSNTEKAYTDELMQQANDEIGMPNITEFYEKKLAKEIFEKRDDSDLICYVYNYSEFEAKYVYVGQSMGYGLPYSTQYTSPEVYEYTTGTTLPQADPNGLYTADGITATWLMMIDEVTGETYIMYCEPTIVVTENKLPVRIIDESSLIGIDY